MPSDSSCLDIDDLGRVGAVLEEAGKDATLCSPRPFPCQTQQTSVPSVLKPDIMDIWTQKYKLVVPADIWSVL